MPKGTPEGAKRPTGSGGSSGARGTSGSASSGYKRVVQESRATRNSPTTSARSVPRSTERWTGSSSQKGVIDMYLNGNSTQKAAAKRIMKRWITD